MTAEPERYDLAFVATSRSRAIADRAGGDFIRNLAALRIIRPVDETVASDWVGAGVNHACLVRAEDTFIFCWGDDLAGQSSLAPQSDKDVFLLVDPGGFHSCGLTDQNEVICWGTNDAGQSTPPPFKGFTRMSSGAQFSCGIQPDTTLTCWGDNRFGQTDAPMGSYEQVSAGFQHVCALTTTGMTQCWGENGSNQCLPP